MTEKRGMHFVLTWLRLLLAFMFAFKAVENLRHLGLRARSLTRICVYYEIPRLCGYTRSYESGSEKKFENEPIRA